MDAQSSKTESNDEMMEVENEHENENGKENGNESKNEKSKRDKCSCESITVKGKQFSITYSLLRVFSTAETTKISLSSKREVQKLNLLNYTFSTDFWISVSRVLAGFRIPIPDIKHKPTINKNKNNNEEETITKIPLQKRYKYKNLNQMNNRQTNCNFEDIHTDIGNWKMIERNLNYDPVSSVRQIPDFGPRSGGLDDCVDGTLTSLSVSKLNIQKNYEKELTLYAGKQSIISY